ncbi:outer membrane beta-barrel protein [Adhaeretor mobilis]|uniref:Porin n=1 Tax=Adhaeretor mobilis TaxID=1930276 RepID=A0A517N075_9BACT|nr:outer membrane beta-barrel protein [Adhaeretor mobilis]QDT00531.1 hypothetical protein HG15A2_38690 [Adhaeretor mobilis]
MKIRTWIVGIAALAMSGNGAAAQTQATDWSYDNNVKAVGCCEDSCCGDDSCCDFDPCCGDACCGDGVGCGSGCGVGGALAGMSLAGALGLEDSGLVVGGWTQVGYHDEQTELSNTFDDGLAFNDLQDRINLHQQYFFLGKDADGSDGWDWGFRTDVMYGTDAQKTQAFGNPGAGTRGFGSYDASLDHGYYGWAIPQAYAELENGDFNVKIGKFYTLVGYEVVTAPDNFFYSHSLTMFNSEPFTHTGVLTSYTGFGGLTLYNGWTAGWDTGFDNTLGGSNYLGGFGLDISDNLSFTYITTYGNFGARDGGQDDSYSHSIVIAASLTDRLEYVFQSDLVGIDATADNGTQIGSNDQTGINQYLFYQWNDRVKLGSRMEWWKSDGTSHYELTSGVNFSVLDNLVVRPEYRMDWAPGLDVDRDTIGIDAILTY